MSGPHLEPPDDAQEPGFEIVTIPIGCFKTYDPVAADNEAERVVELLEQLGGHRADREPLPEARTETVVNKLLADWAEYARPVNTILYWVGHGESKPEGAWLAVYDTRSPMRGTAIEPANLAAHIANQWANRCAPEDNAWAMVVIQACGAERFVELLNSELFRSSNPPKRLVLISVGGYGQSHLGKFIDVLRSVLDSFTDNDTEIRLYDFVGRVNERLEAGFALVELTGRPPPMLRRRQVLPGGVTATIDVYAELQALLPRLTNDERGHFVPKAQGAEQGELAWYFTGRAQERQQICDWLRATESGLLVITGRAGSGKSALLGNVLVYSNPALRGLLVTHHLIDDLPEHERPPDNAFKHVVHLNGLTTAGLVERLLKDLGSKPAGTTLNEALEQLVALLHERKQPFTLMADALDESRQAASIAASVLRRIAAQPGCRVIVGTRRSTKEGPDQPETDDENLLDALGHGANTHIVEVQRDRFAISEYVRRRLSAAKLSGDRSVDEIAQLIQAQPGREFLYARLAVHEILADRTLAQPQNRSQLDELLAHDHRWIFAHAVARLSALNPLNAALLEALALTAGRGLPRADRTWATVAQALIDDPTAKVSDDDIATVLKVAAPYIMLDREDGQSVYRLAHRTFQEHFLGGARDNERRQAQHRRIAAGLLAAAQAGLPHEPSRYVQRHLPQHVAIAGVWSMLTEKPQVLDSIDPDSVASSVLAHTFGRGGEALPSEIAAVVSMRHVLGPLSPEERTLTRTVSMARLGEVVGHAQANATGERQARLCWGCGAALVGAHRPRSRRGCQIVGGACAGGRALPARLER
jgi:alpha-D-ribose 1-methylphosphonate 5-triphosphate synthase subunit PhnG